MSVLWWLNQVLAGVAIAGLLMTAGNYAYVTACYFLFRPRGTRPPASLDDALLPHVLLQIPMFNEPNVVAQAAEGAVALDWPRERLHIQILDDSTDNTPEIAAAVVARLRAWTTTEIVWAGERMDARRAMSGRAVASRQRGGKARA